MNNDKAVNRTLSLKRTSTLTGAVISPQCDRRTQASDTASQVICDCEALVTLRFRHEGQHFMKPGDLEEISVSRLLHFAQIAGLLNALL